MSVRNFKLESLDGTEVRSNSLERLSEEDLKGEANRRALRRFFDAFNTNKAETDGKQILDEQEIDKMFEIIESYSNRTNKSNDKVLDRDEAQVFLDTYEIEPGKTLSKDYKITVDVLFAFLNKFKTNDQNGKYNYFTADIVMNDGNRIEDVGADSEVGQRQQRNLSFDPDKSYQNKNDIDYYLNWGATCSNKDQPTEIEESGQPKELVDIDSLGNMVFYRMENGKQVMLARIIERANGSKILEKFDTTKDGIVSGTAYYAERFTDGHGTTHKKGEPIYSFKEDRSKPFMTNDQTRIYDVVANEYEYPGARFYFRTGAITKYDGKGNSTTYTSQTDENGRPTGIPDRKVETLEREYDTASGSILRYVRTRYDKDSQVATIEIEDAQTRNSTVYDAEGKVIKNVYADLDDKGRIEMLTIHNLQNKTRKVIVYNNDFLKSSQEIMNDDKEFLDYFKTVVVTDIDNAIEYFKDYDNNKNIFQAGALLISGIFGGDSIEDKINNLKAYKREIKEIANMTDTKQAVQKIRSLGFNVTQYRALKMISEKYTNASLYQAMETKIGEAQANIKKGVQNNEYFTDKRKESLLDNLSAYTKYKAEQEQKPEFLRDTNPSENFSNNSLDEILGNLFTEEEDTLSPIIYKAYDILSSILGTENAEGILKRLIKNDKTKSPIDLIDQIYTILGEIKQGIKFEKESILNGMSLTQLGTQFNRLYDSAIGETQVDKAQKFTEIIDNYATGLEFATDIALMFVGPGISGAVVKGIGLAANLGTKAPKIANMATKIVSKYELVTEKGIAFSRAAVGVVDEMALKAAKGESITSDGFAELFTKELILEKFKIPMKSLSKKAYTRFSNKYAKFANRTEFENLRQEAFTKLTKYLQEHPDQFEKIFTGGGAGLISITPGISSLGEEETELIQTYAKEIRTQKVSDEEYNVTIGDETYAIKGSAKEVYLALFNPKEEYGDLASS